MIELKEYISTHPGLPWVQLIDPDKKLLVKLQNAAKKINKAERQHYNALLARLKLHMEPEIAVEAIALFVSIRANSTCIVAED